MHSYTDDVPTYTIDLAEPEEDRWHEVIRAESHLVRQLASEALGDYEVSSWLVRLGGAVLRTAYKWSGGLYSGEIDSWADALGVSRGVVCGLNCSYEIDHKMACTAGVRWVEGKGLVHVRNMDWPLPTIGKATRIFHFVDGGREFYSVGICGFVGVLSGMIPGGYAATINWAPPAEKPGFDFGPAFLLRHVLENHETYEDAVEVLAHTPLSAPVFFVVSGTDTGQACVIERTRSDVAIRRMNPRKPLVQANHHQAAKFLTNNDCFEDLAFSRERARTMTRELACHPRTRSIETVAQALDVEPVLNQESYQQMAFCAATGELMVWRAQ